MDNSLESTNQGGSSNKSAFDDLTREQLITKCKGFLAIAQKAKQAKSDLLNEIESYKIKLHKSETVNKVSQENVRTLQELVDSLTEQKLNYITELDLAQSKTKTLTEKCYNYDEEIQNFKSVVAEKDSHITDIMRKLSELDSETISLKRQNNRLLEENDQLINQLTELEARTAEFNNIGLQQREQLRILEEKVQSDENDKIGELNNKIKELQNNIDANNFKVINELQISDNKIKEITQLYESEKAKKEKANVKLRSYKDKILKCAACINQLKNSRLILSKTVKEYSENIPKWQNDIIKASKVLEDQINELNNENTHLKEKLQQFVKQTNEASQNVIDPKILNSQIDDVSRENDSLRSELSNLEKKLNEFSKNNDVLNNELSELKLKYQQITDTELPTQVNDNKLLKDQLNDLTKNLNILSLENKELSTVVTDQKIKNTNLNDSMQKNVENNYLIENLNLQIKSLESERTILLKDNTNTRDTFAESQNENRALSNQINQMTPEIQMLRMQLEEMSKEKLALEIKYKSKNNGEINNLKCEMKALQQQHDLLKKECGDVQDENTLLKEEVETLKLSLEKPQDVTEELSDMMVSQQADIVKLESKLSSYKQENASLLNEMKQSRAKIKEFDALVAEYENAKSKLSGYKSENTELLNEMKEINQALKERGETISKLQKTVVEMERLIESLEKDRDDINLEKVNLCSKIERLETDLRSAQQSTCKNSEASEQLIAERDNALKYIAEKDTVITTLKMEIERLKEQQSSLVELPNEDMSTSTISKAEEHCRMKDLDESFEDKYTKLRLFALKLKKKLNETVIQLQNAEQDKAKLNKLFNESGVTEKKTTEFTGNDELDSSSKEDNNLIVSDLEMKVKSLQATVDLSDKIAAELETLKVELANKNQELAAEIESHKVTRDNLEKARRDVKKKSVLSLEMEDYERSMKELTVKMEESKIKMVQMESTIDTQEGTIMAMKTQIKLLEEQIKTEETQNRLVKEELQRAIDEGKDKDNLIQTKNGIITKLEHNLEDEKRKNEETDFEMTSYLSEKENIIMSLGEDKIELNNKLKRLEFKCAELNERLNNTNIELADLKMEYTSYKVRAQAVLRQNQTVDHSQEEQLKEESAAHKAQIEKLTAKLATAQERLSEQGAEMEACRRRAAEATNEAARAQQRTARLQADLTRLGQQLESERAQHKLQVSTLTQCYKTQINELEMKLQKETEAFKMQLATTRDNVKTTKVSSSVEEVNHNQYMLPVIPKEEGSDGEMDINVSMIPREDGEGSESAPSPPLSKSYLTSTGSGRSPVPLERLLEEGVPEDIALDTLSLALTPEQEISDLKRKLQAQQQRVQHVTVLLAESERECARMAQLSELLKAELRRVRGATQHAHNTEYMKNVTLKFLTLPPGDERSRLVPVLHKILTLTPEETHKIQAIAKGLDPNPSKGWGSYLPWPGGK